LSSVVAPDVPSSAVLITGIASNPGRHLAPLLKDYLLVGVDVICPMLEHPCTQFCQLDVSQPETPELLEQLIRENNVRKVVHLAFELAPVRAGVAEEKRQWEINVWGTRHVLQAIERANRTQLQVELFVYLSSVTVYGSNLPEPVNEDAPLLGHTFPYALHKRGADQLCQAWYRRLNGCAVYILRSHIFLGKEMDNFILSVLRGQPCGRGWLAKWLRRRGWRLPMILPRGRRYDGLFQFVHIDDVSRLLRWVCTHYVRGKLEILNLQGKGTPVTSAQCASVAGTPLIRLPSYRLVQFLFHVLWWLGLSGVPPEALPYFTGSYIMNPRRLQALLGEDYDHVVRYTTWQALTEAVGN